MYGFNGVGSSGEIKSNDGFISISPMLDGTNRIARL